MSSYGGSTDTKGGRGTKPSCCRAAPDSQEICVGLRVLGKKCGFLVKCRG